MTTKKNLLKLFSVYVDECVADSTDETLVRPLSFDEWYSRHYLPNQEQQDALVESLNLPFGGSHAPDCSYRCHGECDCWRSDPDQNPELSEE